MLQAQERNVAGEKDGEALRGELVANRIARLARASLSWKLTDRQLEVLELVCQGRPNKVVANRLGCSEKTVEAHITGIMRRSRSENRCHLVARFWSEL
jgi:DNA-binding CsgD family transcriptional regulator